MCEIREAAFLDASIRNIPARAFDVEPQQPDPQHAPRLYPKAKTYVSKDLKPKYLFNTPKGRLLNNLIRIVATSASTSAALWE